MSFSFTVTGATKRAAKALVARELSKVAIGQGCHQRDFLQAQAATNAYIDVLPDDETQDVYVAVSGGISGQGWTVSDVERVTGVNVTISASLAPRAA